MMDSILPAELDRSLIHALQINPRISWTDLADVLGVAPMTVARRWERLRDTGLAWVAATPITSYVTAGSIAYVWVNCQAFQQQRVAAQLSNISAVASIDLTAGRHDMLLSVAMPDLGALSGFLVEHLNQTEGVLSSEALIATKGYTEGGRWRLDALSRAQESAVTATRTTVAQPAKPIDQRDRDIIAILEVDGRMPHADVAARVGISPAAARKRIVRLLSSGTVGLRCDLAAPAFGWPIMAYLWARVPPAALEEVARSVARFPSVRLVAAVTGQANLLIAMWLRTVGDLPQAEAALSRNFPPLAFVDRTVSLRTIKRAGRQLDAQGRSTGSVSMAF